MVIGAVDQYLHIQYKLRRLHEHYVVLFQLTLFLYLRLHVQLNEYSFRSPVIIIILI